MPKGLKRADVRSEIERRIADDVGVRISTGNHKLDRIPNLSILPDKNCPGKVAECRYCYARGVLKYSTWTEVQWTVNDFYAHNQPARFEEDLCARIYLARCRYFRIHVGGDFYSQRYLETWFRICRRNPDTKFLAFTKSFLLDYGKKPDNLEVIWSVFPSTDFNLVPLEGSRAYTEFDSIGIYYKYDGWGLEHAFECIGSCESCGMCFNAAENQIDVKFQAHGSAVNFSGRERGPDGRWLPSNGG